MIVCLCDACFLCSLWSLHSSFYSQAHMQARYVILRVLQEIEGFVNISQCIGQDGQPDLVISLDRSKIRNEGKAAIGQFLLKLQVISVMMALYLFSCVCTGYCVCHSSTLCVQCSLMNITIDSFPF